VAQAAANCGGAILALCVVVKRRFDGTQSAFGARRAEAVSKECVGTVVKNRLLVKFVAFLPIYLALAPSILAQAGGKSQQNCEKVGPHTWKHGSIEEMSEQEAVYWGCRMGLPTATIKQWQQASDEPDPISEIKLFTMNKQEFVFIERMGGTMRCRSFTALMNTGKGWEKVWDEYGDMYCGICPELRIRILGSRLVLEVPKSTDANCEQLFHRKEFIWNGKMFRPAE
jgi:hypothetical protein